MEQLVAQLRHYGLALVLANVLLEELGLPLPALPLIFVAGALAWHGRFSLAALVSVATAAALAIDAAWYGLGRWKGMRVLRAICRIALSPEACMRQTQSLFARRGTLSLVVGKFIPGYSIMVLPLSGASGLSLASFLLFGGLGCLLWAGSAALAGYVFHDAVERIIDAAAALGFWAVLAGALALLLAVALKWWQRRRFYKLLRLARITVAELHDLLAADEAPAVVDVRTRPSFQARHIPGALRMTFEEIEQRLATLPRDRELILYCT